MQTKEKIYKTAFALMGKKGFNNISIEDISKKAGVSVGAFYYYYKSKNDILYEIYSRADDYFRIMFPQLKQNTLWTALLNTFKFMQEGRYNVEDKITELFKLQVMIYKAN